MDIAPPARQEKPVTDAPPAARFTLTFLTNEWEWDAELASETLEQAKAAAREALVRMVEEEKPQLACVTLLQDGVKIGVWDWVEQQPWWTRL
jgi:hypothetical protein